MFHFRLPICRHLPSWDLPLVLQFLATPGKVASPSLSLLKLSQRTVFLIAIACGRRASEIHAMSTRREFTSFSDAGVTLLPRAGFLA